MSDVRAIPSGSAIRDQGSRYILIAMPNQNRAGAIRAAITAPGCEAVLVRDGEEARQEMARRGPPLLLILDLSLPRVDGFEVVRELRKLAPRTQSGIIAVSGHSSIRTAAQRIADSLGFAKVLPFDLDRPALRDAVEEVLADLQKPRPAAAPRRVPRRPAATGGGGDPVEAAVLATAGRFRTAVTVVYLKRGNQEAVRGHFAIDEPSGTVSAAHMLSFLREIAAGSDPLIVPDVAHFPALIDLAPGGLPLVRGLAATPLGSSSSAVSGAVCILDTKPLQMDASDLDALEAIGRDLLRELGPDEPAAGNEPDGRTATSPVDVDALQQLAATDPLTGLANRRGGDDNIAMEIARARRHRTPLSCVLLDLDHFKEVNDTFGHQAGDYALREIGTLLRRTLRAYDIIIRWGGEEFLIVLPGVEVDSARTLAERMRKGIQGLALSGIGGVTASFGVAELGPDYSFDTMFAAADRRLYTAKSRGRNSVV